MNPVTIGSVSIGKGRPKIIVPIVEKSAADILSRAAEFSTLAPDVVEWRADWFDAASQDTALLSCLHGLRERLGDIPLLVTFRTKAEGGEREISAPEYEHFCRIVCESRCAELLDVELFTEDAVRARIFSLAHTNGVKIICSSHDFQKTPPQKELIARLCRMQALGADIVKLAVMPQSRADVLTLLAATAEMAEQHPETPVVTMSMGALGAVSRLAGEAFGSAMTFASAGKASAPGQIDFETMDAVLDRLRLESVYRKANKLLYQ